MKSQTGWVLKSKKNGKYLDWNDDYEYTSNIFNARFYSTRRKARDCKPVSETVRKVVITVY